MKLSSRLQKIVNYINNDDRVIDVGCDHGYVAVALAKKFPNNLVLATDISINSLKSARENIIKYNMINQVQTIVSKGLESVNVRELNTIIIAGLGGKTMIEILSESFKKLESINKIILCPNNNFSEVRFAITKLGFFIEQEEAVLENEKYYEIIIFSKGCSNYTKKELQFGPYLLNNAITKNHYLIEKTL